MSRQKSSTKHALLNCVLKRNIDPILPIFKMSSNEIFLDYTVNLIRDCLTYLYMMDNEYEHVEYLVIVVLIKMNLLNPIKIEGLCNK